MAHCPSQDWDRYCNEQDESAAREIAWWKENKDRVLHVTCAMLSNPASQGSDEDTMIEIAASLVKKITDRAETDL